MQKLLVAILGTLLITNSVLAQNGPGPNGNPGANLPAPGQQGPGPGSDRQGRGERFERLKEKFDTNHDGVLDDNERAQMRAFMQQRRQQRMQQGGGGGQFGGGGSRWQQSQGQNLPPAGNTTN